MLFAEGLKDFSGEQLEDDKTLINTSPELLGNTQNRPKLPENRKITPKRSVRPLRNRLFFGATAALLIAAGVIAERTSHKGAESANLTTQERLARISNPDKTLNIGAVKYDAANDRFLFAGRPATSTIETQNRIYESKFDGSGFPEFKPISGPSVQNRLYSIGINSTIYVSGDGDITSSKQEGMVERVPQADGVMNSSVQLEKVSLPDNPNAYTTIRRIDSLDENTLNFVRWEHGYPDAYFLYDCMTGAITATQKLTYTGAAISFLGKVDNKYFDYYSNGEDPNTAEGVVVKTVFDRKTGNITDSKVLTRTSFGPTVIIGKKDAVGDVSRITYINNRTSEIGMVTPTGESISREYYRGWVDGKYPDLEDNSLNFLTGISFDSIDWYGGQIYAKSGGSRPIVVGVKPDGTKVSHILNFKDDIVVKSIEFINDNGVIGLLITSRSAEGLSEMYLLETNADGTPKDGARVFTLGKIKDNTTEPTPTPTNTPSPTSTPTQTPTTVVASPTGVVSSTAIAATSTAVNPTSTATFSPTSSPTAMATSTPTNTPMRTSTPTTTATSTRTSVGFKVFLPVTVRAQGSSW